MARDTSADHAGHRERLRKRFLRAGGDALADYELLELLLFIPPPSSAAVLPANVQSMSVELL